MATRSPEAQAAYKRITESPTFNDLSGAEKRQALLVWKAKYDPPKSATVDVKSEPNLSAIGNEARQANRKVETAKPLLPQRRELPQPQRQGPPLPTPGSNIPVVNELLRGMVASPSRTAPASQGRPTLPPEFEQGLAPSSGGMLSALSQAQPFVENVLPQFALQASPLGPFLGPAVAVAGMQGANYGTQINNGQMSREDAQRNLGTDLAGTAMLGPLNKMLPGNGLLQAATRNVAQGVLPAELDEAVTGRMQDPLMMAVGMGLGAAADVYTGQSPDLAPVKQAVNDLVAPPRTAQAGMAVADDASFGGVFRKGDEPPTGGTVPPVSAPDPFAGSKAGSRKAQLIQDALDDGSLAFDHRTGYWGIGPRTAKRPADIIDPKAKTRAEKAAALQTDYETAQRIYASQGQEMPADKRQAWEDRINVASKANTAGSSAASAPNPADAPAPQPDPVAPPPPPPIDPPAAGPAAPPPDPQRGPVTVEVVGPAAPRPAEPVQQQPGQFPDPKPTPEMGRVYGPDANNLRGEARQTIKDVARAVDNAPRPAVDPERVAAVRETIDASLNQRKGFIRSDKLSGMSDATRNDLLTRAAEVVVEEGLDPKARIGFDVIRDQAERISPEVLRDLQPPKNGETVHPAVWRAASEQIDANAKAISDIEGKIIEATKNGDAEGASALKSQLAVLENDTKRLLAVTIPTRSQNGRNLAYHRIVNQGSFSNEYWLSRAARAAGVEALDDATITKVRDITLKGQRAADAGDAAGADAARIELAKMLAGLEKSTTLETVSAVIKAGLLTSPKTHIRNIGGNAAFQLAEEVSRIPAAALDMVLSFGGNGRRTISGFDPVALAKAAHDGATKGVQAGREIWRQGGTNDALKRFDLPRELNSGNKWLDAYTNKVFRSLSAEDQWFKAAAIRRSLDDQAYIVARNEVKTGAIQRNQIKQRAAELVAKPDDAMMVNAMAAADEATFQNDNRASKRWSAIMAQGKKDGDTFGNFVLGTAVAPFVKTPTNVVARMLDYMGVGAPKVAIAVAKRIMGKLTPEEQRAASKAFGRGLVGWGMVYLGMKAYEKGIATGLTTEEDAGTRGANQLANRPEGAIRVGDSWLQLTGVAPLGGLFVLGATLAQEGSRTSADPMKPVVNSVAAATQVMLQNPMAQGAQNVLDAVKDPLGAGERYLTGLPSMAVPTAVSDVGQMLDDSQRQTFSRASGPALNVVRQVAGKVPGVRNLLPEKQDPFGRNLPTNPAALIDPFNSKSATEATDPVVREIAQNRADVNAPKAYVDVTNDGGEKRRVQLTPMQQNQYKQSFGQYAREAIEILMEDPDYQAASVKERQAMLEEELKSARTQATEEIKATLAP